MGKTICEHILLCELDDGISSKLWVVGPGKNSSGLRLEEEKTECFHFRSVEKGEQD